MYTCTLRTLARRPVALHKKKQDSGSETVIATPTATALLRILRILNPQWSTSMALIMIGSIHIQRTYIPTLHTHIVYIDCAAPKIVEHVECVRTYYGTYILRVAVQAQLTTPSKIGRYMRE